MEGARGGGEAAKPARESIRHAHPPEEARMITVGLDMGARQCKAVVLRDGEVVGRGTEFSGVDEQMSARRAVQRALDAAGVGEGEVDGFATTGGGRSETPFKGADLTDVSAATRGAMFVLPDTRTVLDVGSEEGRAIRAEPPAKVIDFSINERCAAGAGAFTESMARALEVPVEEIGPLSLESTRAIPINAQCVVFAESEVIGLLHQQTPKADIARAVHDAIADRISSLVLKLGVLPPVAVIGGMATNVGFVDSLDRTLALRVLVPEHPEYVGALGAALVAADGVTAEVSS